MINNTNLAIVDSEEIVEENQIALVEGYQLEEQSKFKLITKLKKISYLTLKRIFDICCSIVGIAIMIPIAVIIKIMYVLNKDFDPIFFKQKRFGKNGKVFDFYKFRSMVPNADEVLKKILSENEELAEEYRINKKLRNDPRLTKIGGFLRRLSLDEIPQFINVIKGEMSVIGNRPYLIREKKDMGEYFDQILKTKCGIISYWAVNGRSDVSFEKRLDLEMYYSNNQSLKMDIQIFFKVFKVVFSCKGAK